MACEDFPCCGHEAGCCPDYDESGRQLNMRCTCGAIVPINARSSLCETCLGIGEPDEHEWDEDDCEDDCEPAMRDDDDYREHGYYF